MTELKPVEPRTTEPPAGRRRNRLVTVVAILVTGLAVFWLGYSIGRVQNIATVASLARDADVDRYSLSRGGILLDFERLGGGGKPYIRSADGYELLDVSDWDHNSRIVVDGTPYELVRLFPTSSVDYGQYRLAETLQGEGFLLEREIQLNSDGSVHLSHTFVARKPIRHVDFALAYVHAVMSGLRVADRQVSAAVTRQIRQPTAAGNQAPAAYRLQVGADSSAPVITYRSSEATALGATSFVANMATDEPRQDERVVLGAETIRIEPVQ